jgi:two-component system sensor histidine kinase/response regulator
MEQPGSESAGASGTRRGGFIKIVLIYATFASLWIVLSDHFIGRLFDSLPQLAFFGTLKGLLFVGITSLVLFVLLQRFAGGAATGGEDAVAAGGRGWMSAVFGVLVLAIAAIGWLSYRMMADTVERDRTAKLVAIADFKAKDVVEWLTERRTDIHEITGGSLFRLAVLEWMRSRDPALRTRLIERLEQARKAHRYAGIAFFDTAGRPLFGVGETDGLGVDVRDMADKARRRGEPSLLDLQRVGADGHVRFGYVDAVLDGIGPGAKTQAIAVFSMDPAERLFPMVQAWPYPIPSGESALARRDGDDVVFLNMLRFSGAQPLAQRFPLSRQDLPAAQAALHGSGIYQGNDYRGTPVFTVAREVADTSWLVLAKVDRAEIFQDVGRVASVTLALTIAAIIACALLLALIWRQQRWREALSREEAIRRSEARFRFLFGNMLEGFAYSRMVFEDDQPVDFVYLDVNPAFERLTGLRNVVGRPVSEVLPGIRETNPALFEAYGRVARGGPPEHFELYVEQLRGWFSLSTYGVEPGCFVAVFEVITERKNAQAQLEEQRSRLQGLVQTIPDLVWLKDPEGIYLLCNPSFERFLGAAEADIVGKTDYDFVSKDLAEFFREKDRQAVAAGRPSINEEWVQFADSQHRTLLETTKTPMFDAAGKLIGVLGIGRDITARRQAEDQLRMLWLAVEQSPSSVIITDVEGHIEYINEACVQNTGYSREELVGANPRIFRSGQTPEETYDAFWNELSQGRQWQGEFINRRKNGEIHIDFVHATPVRQPDGVVAHYLAIQEDVTERKRMGQELDKHRFHLEELVAERTAQLAAAREAAEVAAQAKGAFVANISHEIRTPLNAILGFTHLLQRHTRDPEQNDKLTKIDEAGHHLLALINDILDFSKIEAGKIALERRDFRLSTLIENVFALVRDKALSKGLQLVEDIDPALPAMLCGDPTRLSQALLNYVSNAVKFSERGNIVLRVRPIDESGGALRVQFAVQDEGIGIDATALSRLFEDFEQADQSTTRKYGGTGLGLAITRRLAELMEGEVAVESEPGVGSTFFLTVKLARGAAAPHGEAAQAHMPHAEETLRRECFGASLLLVEDNAINREVATELLEEAGCQVDTAEDGAQAVAMARRRAYDLILMDVHMPVMDGLAAARAIRALPERNATPIVALTASAFNEDRRSCVDAGMNDHIAKPIEPEALFATLLRWLPKRKGAPPPAPPAKQEAPAPAPQLPDIAGLDAAAGVKTVRGRVATYRRLLRLFADSHADDMGTLRRHLAAGDREAATRVAHSLKSASAMMGAMAIHVLAEKLEAALRQQADDAESLVASLEAQLAPLAAALRAALPDEPAEAATTTATTAAFARLEALLAEDNIEANQALREALPELRARLGAATATLERQIAAYDYAAALATLRAACADASGDAS